MLKQQLNIAGIPAILWGAPSNALFIGVHGNLSSKDDLSFLAEAAIPMGYQVLTFDLPEHGDRKNQGIPCKVQQCVQELETVLDYAKARWHTISLFGCSMGAYFSLLAYPKEALKQCLFLSPVVDMASIIQGMMDALQISEERLKAENEIPTPFGHTLYWDYYHYVKTHPIVAWSQPTSILSGALDAMCPVAVTTDFAHRFHCHLQVAEGCEHYFHTREQMQMVTHWLTANILPIE